MRSKRFKGLFCLYKSSVSVLLTAGILGSCSSDFSRFTDGITKSSAPSQNTIQNGPAGEYPPAPQKNAYSKVESSNLAPPPAPANITADADNSSFSEREMSQRSSDPVSVHEKNIAAAQAGSTAQSAHKSVYLVQEGDNLIRIARRYKVTVASIKRDNELSSDKILIGQKLTITGGVAAASLDKEKAAETGKASNIIPTPLPEPIEPPQNTEQIGKDNAANSANITKPAETAVKPEEKENKAEKAIIAGSAAAGAAAATGETTDSKNLPDNSAQAGSKAIQADKDSNPVVKDADKDKKATDAAAMVWPVNGNIISFYGQRTGTSTNDGIDIAVPEGTRVKAADNGMVIYAGDGLKEFGNTILIRHDDNIVTVYGHNSKLLVQRGQQVGRGEDIALSGNSGNASVAKLHFEVRKNSAPVNPTKYLPSAR